MRKFLDTFLQKLRHNATFYLKRRSFCLHTDTLTQDPIQVRKRTGKGAFRLRVDYVSFTSRLRVVYVFFTCLTAKKQVNLGLVGINGW